jgi:hypothetical protein
VADSLKAKLARLKALEGADDRAAAMEVRKALRDPNAYLVGVAACLASQRALDELIPDLLTAYDRLFDPNPADPDLGLDPLATGKRAIATALKALDFPEAEPFLRGLHHVQLEPAFGGKSDVAADLRVLCAQALVSCRIDANALLTHFVDRLADPILFVRLEIVRAMAALGVPAGDLLLRLKVLNGDREPEVIGECLRALLAGTSSEAVAFVERVLLSGHEPVVLEAASALAESRNPAALAAVRRFWDGDVSNATRRALVLSCGGSPLPGTADFLLDVIAEHRRDIAIFALEALASSRFARERRQRARDAAAATGDRGIRLAFEQYFGVTEND